MLDAFLVPEKTIVTAKGDSAAVDVSAANPVFLVTLSITEVVEQESSRSRYLRQPTATTWEPKPVASFPQRFYIGEYPLLVDLSSAANAKFLRAHWEVSRWGRGSTTPKFEFALRLREVSREALLEAQTEAHTRR